MISQELFDETLLENQDVFDLTPEQALEETIEEFTERQKTSVSHLVLLHPDSLEGKKERECRKRFNEWLNLLDGMIETDGSVKVEEEGNLAVDALRGVRMCCKNGWTGEDNEAKNDDASISNNNKDDEDETGENDNEEEKEDLPNDGENKFDTTTTNDENGANIENKKTSKKNDAALPYLTLFHQSNAVFTFMSLLGVISLSSSPENNKNKEIILHETLLTLIEILKPSTSNSPATKDIKATLKDNFVAFERLVGLIFHYAKLCSAEKDSGKEESSSDMTILTDLIRLATVSCRMCEANKVSFVKACKNKKTQNEEEKGGINAVMKVLHLPSANTPNKKQPYTKNETILWLETCQLITTLCKYDDFRTNNNTQSQQQHGINVSSAHDHVMEFFRVGVVPILHDILAYSLKNESEIVDVNLAASAMSATRVLAVNDEIVQCLVAVGILKSARTALDAGLAADDDGKTNGGQDEKLQMSGDGNAAKARLTSASLGLIRNLCGNDEIKTTLCLGNATSESTATDLSSSSIVPSIIQAMKKYKNNPIVQEHGCGTFAAMALRKPKNALRILQDNDADGARVICTCMKRFPNHVPLQRQACLAIRNIVSRLMKMHSSESDGGGDLENEIGENADEGGTINVREIFLDLGVEQILRHVAGRHQGSVDEAYAALRDLGCQVSLVKFNTEDGSEEVKPVGRTMMFGETKPKFRPVFEESEGLNGSVGDCIEDRIAAVAEANGAGVF